MPRPRPSIPRHEVPALRQRAERLRELGRTADLLRSGFMSARDVWNARGRDVTLVTVFSHLARLRSMPGLRLSQERVWAASRGPATTRYRLDFAPKGTFTVPGVTEHLPPPPPFEPVTDDGTEA